MRDTFPGRVTIRSAKQLDTATALIVSLQRQQAQAEDALEAELAAVRARHARKFTCVAAGDRVSIEERLEQLQNAVTRFADKHRAKMFRTGTKTTQLPGASLQLRDEAGRIDFQPGYNRRTVSAGLVASVDGWQMAVNQFLLDCGLLGWVVLQPDLDWEGLKRGLRDGTIDPEEAAEYGMDWVKPVRTRISNRQR